MIGITLFAGRRRRHIRALGFNPLVRASDRLEALAILAVFGTALFALPIAASAAHLIYDAGVRTATEQSRDRHSVQAVAVDGNASMPSDFDSTAYVRAQWHEGAQLRTERVITPATVKAGEPMTIWLDGSDDVVAAPLTLEDAKVSALGTAGTVWIALIGGSALIAYVIRRGLDRSRDRAWERELQLMAYNDDGWANRHS